MSACGNAGVCESPAFMYGLSTYYKLMMYTESAQVSNYSVSLQINLYHSTLICITRINLYHHIGTVHFRTLFTSYSNVHIQGVSHVSSTCSARASEGP